MISIITVTLDNLDGLKKTILSIKNQSLMNWELIIKDGLSNDGTTAFYNSDLKNDNRIIFNSTKDNGIYDAMNQGLELAKNEYVIFMNSGDIFYDDKVLENFSFFEKNNKCDIYLGDSVFKINDSFIKRPSKKISYINYGQPSLHQSTIFKTNFHKNFPYSLDYEVSSDYATLLMMYVNNGRILNLPFCISLFEVDKNSKSFKNQKISRKEMSRAQKKILKLNVFHIMLNNFVRFLKNNIMKVVYKITQIKAKYD